MPAQVQTDIANLAISHCGVSKPIADITTDHSLEAQMCLTWFDTARRMTLVKIPWSFATQQIAPTLVATYPTNEWMYAYQYPANALKLVKFMSWQLNNDTRQSRVPYRVMQPVSINLSAAPTPPTQPYQASGMWLYTNWPGTNISLPTAIEYIFDNVDVAQWTDNFNWALSLKLAELIVTTLTTGDPQNKKQALKADFDQAISIASLDNANEEQRPEEPQSEFIRARDGDTAFGFPGMSWVAQPAGFSIN